MRGYTNALFTYLLIAGRSVLPTDRLAVFVLKQVSGPDTT